LLAGGIVAMAAMGGHVASAQDAGEVSKASLVAEATRVQPGQTILLGLQFELESHWHIYWDGRNDTGFAPMVDWTLPEGVTVGPMLWPAPHRYVSPGDILDHVYEGRPTILVPLTIGEDVEAGTTLEIAGQVEWLVCKDVCLPGFGSVSVNLDVASGGNETNAGALPASDPIGRAAARLPQPVLPDRPVDGLDLQWGDEAVTVRFAGATQLAFYPASESSSLVSALADGEAKGDTLTLRLAPKSRDLSGNTELRLAGVLEVRAAASQPKWYLIDYSADGLRKPDDAEAIARVRDRVGAKPESGR
jgi:thiol:disulfide interchange protein DsbD